jgi:hypothetical protein
LAVIGNSHTWKASALPYPCILKATNKQNQTVKIRLHSLFDPLGPSLGHNGPYLAILGPSCDVLRLLDDVPGHPKKTRRHGKGTMGRHKISRYWGPF